MWDIRIASHCRWRSEIGERCGSEHGSEHFDESAHAVVTYGDRGVSDRASFREHFQGCEQSCLLTPASKGHSYVGRKCAHEGSARHPGHLSPVLESPSIGNILEQSLGNLGQLLIAGKRQTQRVFLGLPEFVAEHRHQTLLLRRKQLRWFAGAKAMDHCKE